MKHSYSVMLCCENVAATILQISIAQRLMAIQIRRNFPHTVGAPEHEFNESGKRKTCTVSPELRWFWVKIKYPKTRWFSINNPIGSMYAIYGNIYHQFTPNVSIYTIHGSYGSGHNQIVANSTVVPHGHLIYVELG